MSMTLEQIAEKARNYAIKPGERRARRVSLMRALRSDCAISGGTRTEQKTKGQTISGCAEHQQEQLVTVGPNGNARPIA